MMENNGFVYLIIIVIWSDIDFLKFVNIDIDDDATLVLFALHSESFIKSILGTMQSGHVYICCLFFKLIEKFGDKTSLFLNFIWDTSTVLAPRH